MPFLTLALTPADQIVGVGETTRVTLYVTNGSTVAARDVTVTLPIPKGVTITAAARGRVTSGAVTWTQDTLAPQETVAVTVDVRVDRPVPGRAVLLQPTAQAPDAAAVTTTGGFLVRTKRTHRAVVRHQPEQLTVLADDEGDITISVPPQAATTPLTLTLSNAASAIDPQPAGLPQGNRSFQPFYLNATDAQGKAVHRFARPLTFTLRFTDEQLLALGIAPEDLGLYWYDDQTDAWVLAADAALDRNGRVVRFAVDHFSVFALSDATSFSNAYVPSLKDYQVSQFTGSASYRIPIELPAGAGGMKPHLALSYSSASGDGMSALRPYWQAPWTGRGWDGMCQ